VESRLSDIRTAYNAYDKSGSKQLRAQSPITSAMMMIHPRQYPLDAADHSETIHLSFGQGPPRDRSQLVSTGQWLINPFFNTEEEDQV